MSDVDKVEIGPATLYRGDCLQVVELLKGWDCCLTDPPYEAGAHTDSRQVATAQGLVVQSHRFEAMDEFTRNRITELIAKETKFWSLIFCQNEGAHFWREAFRAHGVKPYSTMVWTKPDGKPNYNGTGPGVGYESIVTTWHGEGRSTWNGGGRIGVFSVNKNEKKDEGNIHTTVKPQKLMTDLVGLFTNKEEVILDCFMGSGSTGVAAVATGRRFIGIERDPEYFEICCKRIEAAMNVVKLEGNTYVKTKAKVAVPLIEVAPKPIAGPKLAAPKARAAAPSQPRQRAQQAQEPARKRFAPPTLVTVATPAPQAAKSKPTPNLMPTAWAEQLKRADGRVMSFDEGTWDEGGKGAIGLDVEVFKNFFLVCLKNFNTGKQIAFEHSDRCGMDRERLEKILKNECIITFNGNSFDMIMVYLFLSKNYTTMQLKSAADRIIRTGMKSWQSEKEFGVIVPKLNHVDLMEPNPAIRMGLKTIYGRLHGKFMMDLPFPPDTYLSDEQMNVTTLYCFNDLDATHKLFDTLREPLLLRQNLTKIYGVDMRSKSDAQVGEAIIKVRAEKLLKRKIHKSDSIPSHANYKLPPFIKFETPEMREIVSKIESSIFHVNEYGKVLMPEWMKGLQVEFGGMKFSMGIGGLHSTEETRALHSDDNNFLLDVDVARQYPNIIRKIGMYPQAVGPVFKDIYGNIIDVGMSAKDKLKTISKDDPEYGPTQTESESCKIQGNGVFGKQLSMHSFLYAPDMGIATTITGQLSILMMVEQATAANIPVVSGNTDGIVFYCPRDKKEELDVILAAWEDRLGFKVERTYYKSLYNSNVNVYIGVKEDGKFKLKGPHGDPWSEKDLRGMMMKNPQMTVLTDAVLEFIKSGASFEETIRACKDPRKFVTVINVKGGATWRGASLGKVVRYYYSTDSDPVLGANRKVAKTDGAKPMMELPDTLPDDVDYEKYVKEAEDLAIDLGVIEKSGLLTNRGDKK